MYLCTFIAIAITNSASMNNSSTTFSNYKVVYVNCCALRYGSGAVF